MLSLLQKAEELKGTGYVHTALTYLFTTGKVEDEELFLKTIQTGLSPEARGTIMTGAELFEAQGDVRARKAIAEKLLREEGLPLDTVSRVTQLSMAEIKSLLHEKNN